MRTWYENMKNANALLAKESKKPSGLGVSICWAIEGRATARVVRAQMGGRDASAMICRHDRGSVAIGSRV